MARGVVITGPIAAGKNTTADALATRLVERGSKVVVVDLDEIAAMVRPSGAGPAGLWFAAHQAHGAVVGQWMRADVDLVIAVGPIYSPEERDALTALLPADADLRWIVVEAPLDVTLARAQSDPTRGLSRDRAFHTTAHARYRSLRAGIPHDMVFDSSVTSAQEMARAVDSALALRRRTRATWSEEC